MVDYVLTVAVSVSSGVEYLGSAIPFVAEHKVGIGVWMVVLFALVNLRGIRESGLAFAAPCYAFIVGILAPGRHRPRSLCRAGSRSRGTDRGVRDRARGRRARRHRRRLPRPAGFRVRLCRPDRVRGDQQRGARVREAEGRQRGDRARDHGRSVGGDVRRDGGTRACSRTSGWRKTRPSTSSSAGSPRGLAISRTRSSPRCRLRSSETDPSLSSTWPSSLPSSCSWPRTPHSTASLSSPRSSPGTGSCRVNCTPAAIGSRSATASSRWPRWPG